MTAQTAERPLSAAGAQKKSRQAITAKAACAIAMARASGRT